VTVPDRGVDLVVGSGVTVAASVSSASVLDVALRACSGVGGGVSSSRSRVSGSSVGRIVAVGVGSLRRATVVGAANSVPSKRVRLLSRLESGRAKKARTAVTPPAASRATAIGVARRVRTITRSGREGCEWTMAERLCGKVMAGWGVPRSYG
jgi:hypothetical protein